MNCCKAHHLLDLNVRKDKCHDGSKPSDTSCKHANSIPIDDPDQSRRELSTFAKKINSLEISNRKAYHEYFFEAKYIAGLVLQGTEIKSLRAGKASFNDSYCLFENGELFVRSLHISEYSFGTYTNHEPMQERKLLLNKRELRKLESKIKEKGYSIIPLKIFLTDKGFFKMEIGLGKGKKNYDKRESIKERETDRDIKRKYGI